MAEKICQQQCRSHNALLQVFPNICCVKRSTALQWLGPRGHLHSGCPRAALLGPFLCRQAAPGGSSTCWYLVLLTSVVCNRPPSKASQEKGLGQTSSGNKKSRSVAVGLTNVIMFPVPVGTLISLSHHHEPRARRKFFAFRYCGRQGSFQTQVASIALFHFSRTETS